MGGWIRNPIFTGLVGQRIALLRSPEDMRHLLSLALVVLSAITSNATHIIGSGGAWHCVTMEFGVP